MKDQKDALALVLTVVLAFGVIAALTGQEKWVRTTISSSAAETPSSRPGAVQTEPAAQEAGCAELSYSAYLAAPGLSKDRYCTKTSIDIKLNRKDIAYYKVTADKGFLSDNSVDDAKSLKIYPNSGNYLFYSICTGDKFIPFENDTIRFDFYDSCGDPAGSSTLSVILDRESGNYRLGEFGGGAAART